MCVPTYLRRENFAFERYFNRVPIAFEFYRIAFKGYIMFDLILSLIFLAEELHRTNCSFPAENIHFCTCINALWYIAGACILRIALNSVGLANATCIFLDFRNVSLMLLFVTPKRWGLYVACVDSCLMDLLGNIIFKPRLSRLYSNFKTCIC